MKRALVSNCGLFFCSYNAGAVGELCRRLGPEHFDQHFCSSGSIFASTFCIANQPDTMEAIWRHDVCDGQLLKWQKLVWDEALDLEYLIGVFQNKTRRLDVDALFASKAKVNYALTDYRTGRPLMAQPDASNIWTLMRAACAMPHLYSPVRTQYGLMIDGGLSVACPLKQALDVGFDEVVVVYNKTQDFVCHRTDTLLCAIVELVLPRRLRVLLRSFEERRIEIERLYFRDPRVRLIRPTSPLPISSMFDSDRQRLNDTIDRGIEDARQFVRYL